MFHVLHSLTHLNMVVNLANYRSSNRRYSLKKVVLKNFSKFTGKHLCQSLLVKLQASAPATLLKETLVQVFSCEFFEIFKNTLPCSWKRFKNFKSWLLKLVYLHLWDGHHLTIINLFLVTYKIKIINFTYMCLLTIYLHI